MTLKSSFIADLKKEQQLALFLDGCYNKHLTYYNFERIHDKKGQFEGIDLILTHKNTGAFFAVDEKAQLDYINDDLPTFAFELSYRKAGITKKGWFYDADKKTEFYSLVTGIYADAPNTYTACKITLVNRKKLISFLRDKGVTQSLLTSYVENNEAVNGKLKLKELNHRTEGYLYVSSKNKAEKPVNLVLRLDFLLKNGLAKRLV